MFFFPVLPPLIDPALFKSFSRIAELTRIPDTLVRATRAPDILAAFRAPDTLAAFRSPVGRRPPLACPPVLSPKNELQAAYDAWAASRPQRPTRSEDRDWAKERGISQKRVAKLRAASPDPRLRGLGRRPK